MILRRVARLVAVWVAALWVAPAAVAQNVDRLVLIKADGLAQNIVDEFVVQRDPQTGKSLLPWIDHVFYQGGTRLENFYVRGTSLSGPSWSMLDTGQSLQIKGNVEFDRYTQHPYDYLNFIPYWLGNAARKQGDMWGTSVLDDLRLPMLLDAYDHDARLQSFQLFQRGSRWMTLRQGLQERFTSRKPKELFDEWQTGFEARGIVGEQVERELLAALDDPKVKYLDIYETEFDHATHGNRERQQHLDALQELDALVGRLWTGIARSPFADRTALVLVSDHGVNSDERFYSQGFNLVSLLASRAGGGHHVITKRRLLKDYSIKGIYPLVPLITSTSPDTLYLKGKQNEYQTALLDFDGNERASIHLRDSTLNTIHILMMQLQRRDLSPDVRRAVIDQLLSIVNQHRAAWTETIAGVNEELTALRAAAQTLRARVLPPEDKRKKSRSKKQKTPPVVLTDEESERRIREIGQVETWEREDLEYSAYLASLTRLLALTRETLERPLDVTKYVVPGAMGERNTLYDLQQYIAGPSPAGMVLAPDGSLDMERSFTRVDYFTLLTSARVRNTQDGVGHVPIDMVSLRLPCAPGMTIDGVVPDACVWLNGGSESQALLLVRTGADGRPQLRYLPIAALAQDAAGVTRFERRPWAAGLPMRMWEDENLELPAGSTRDAWLNGWHSDEEWLHAVHRGRYSNGIVGLYEQMAPHTWAGLDVSAPGLDAQERLLRRFRQRQRALVEPDMLIMASDHWNFDVRGFNPGGNHGSFLRPSTHSVFMIAGGARTGIPRGKAVTEPYDSLSFVPTMLTLTGRLEGDNQPDAELRRRGFHQFPGRVVREFIGPVPRDSETSSAAP